MRIASYVALAVLSLACWPSNIAFSADNDAKARSQFEEVVAALNERNFEPIKAAIDQTDMINRVFSVRPVATEAQEAFRAGFWAGIEQQWLAGVPDANGELVDFRFVDGKGRAIVRYALPRYFYVYQVWTLRHDNRGRLRIVDWRNPAMAESFVEEMNAELVVAMPSPAVTRQALNLQSSTDGEVFQAAELLKAIRDQQPERFFQIYDQLEMPVIRQFIVAKAAIEFAAARGDTARLMKASGVFLVSYGEDPQYGLANSNNHFFMDSYDIAYNYLARYYRVADFKEGSMPSRLSALALVLGKTEEAESYALAATQREPSFELGWWSLLRARARAGNFEAALEALEALEDNFNKRMDEAKLRRDQYGAFIKLAESDEFQKWRASRP